MIGDTTFLEVCRERDEARAEVERLRAAIEHHRIVRYRGGPVTDRRDERLYAALEKTHTEAS